MPSSPSLRLPLLDLWCKTIKRYIRSRLRTEVSIDERPVIVDSLHFMITRLKWFQAEGDQIWIDLSKPEPSAIEDPINHIRIICKDFAQRVYRADPTFGEGGMYASQTPWNIQVAPPEVKQYLRERVVERVLDKYFIFTPGSGVTDELPVVNYD